VSPVNLKRTTTNKGRYYEWRAEDGKFWSVTTIVNGGLPKPVLVNWAKKYVATYAVENISKLNALLDPGETGFVDTEGAIGWLKESPYRDRDRRGALGTLVHDAAEAYILGKPYPEWGKEMQPRMEQFLRFLEEWQPTYAEGMVEAPVYNRAERYAGTLDGICDIGGRRVLIDYKTGKGVYPEVALQLAAYRHAEFIGAPDGSEIPMPTVDACVVLHIPDEGEYQLIEVRADDEVFQAFKYVREVFRFMEETSKRVLLGPFPSTLESAPEFGGPDMPDEDELGDAILAVAREQLGIPTVARGQTDLPEGY
jgi:hypothetical protein